MNYLIWPASLAGLISTAVIFGTDMFFLTVGRPALRSAAESAATEVMGFIHVSEIGGCLSGAAWLSCLISSWLCSVRGASGVLSVVGLYADSLRGHIQPFLKANQSTSNRGGESGKKTGQRVRWRRLGTVP